MSKIKQAETPSFSRHGIEHHWKGNFWGTCFPR